MDQETVSKLVLNGDLSRLSEDQKVDYYVYRCSAVGLDPATKPFEILKMQGKEIMYATKECSSQISKRDGLSVTVVKEESVSDIYKVTARAKEAKGRETDDVGCVTIKGLTGDALCNAIMKATTKAKRRAILSHAGLGMLDESEIETIPETKPIQSVVKEPLVVIDSNAANKSDFLAAAQQAHDNAKANGYQPAPAGESNPLDDAAPEDAAPAPQKRADNIPHDAQVMLVEVVGFNPNPRPVGKNGSNSYSLRVKPVEGPDQSEVWTSTFHKDAWEYGKLLKGMRAHLTYKLRKGFLNFYDIEGV